MSRIECNGFHITCDRCGDEQYFDDHYASREAGWQMTGVACDLCPDCSNLLTEVTKKFMTGKSFTVQAGHVIPLSGLLFPYDRKVTEDVQNRGEDNCE